MNDTKQPEPLRLAAQLRDMSSKFKTPSHERGVCNGAMQELRRLHAELELITAIADDLQALCDRQALRIAALEQPNTGIPASAPEGWKLVPLEPNCSMVLAGERSLEQHDFLRLDSAYRAMLAAAPQPQEGEPAPREIR